MHLEENLRAGMTLEEARRDAQIKLGGAERIKEVYRDRRGLPMLETLGQDFRFGGRILRKNPGFTAVAILTLALGIGANTAIFSFVNAVLIRPLPFAEPDRLVRIFEKNDKLNLPQFSSSTLNYLSWKEQLPPFERMGLIGFASFNLTGGGDPEQFSAVTISASLMPMLGIRPELGRVFRDDEEKPGSPAVVIISEGLWKRRFGGDKSLVGQTIMLNELPYTVVGIAPPSLAVLTGADVSVPFTVDPAKEQRLNHLTVAVGRLKRGITLAQSQAEMDAVARRVGEQYPEVKDWGVALVPFSHWFVSDQLRTALIVLLAAVLFVLLIACANIANLLLSRAASRQTEIAVRLALGAGRGRLLCQLLAESLLLACLGGSAGILTGIWAAHAMKAAMPANLLPVSDISVDSTVMLFALGISMATGLVFGLVPAWHTAKTDLNEVLKQGGRSGSAAARPLLRKALIAGELALATVLLIGAGLLMQSLIRLQRVRLGFEAQHLLTFQLSPPATKYQGVPKLWGLYKSLMDSFETIPGVRGAAISSGIPFGAGSYNTTPTYPVGKSLLPVGQAIPIDWRVVSPSYFRTMDVPLIRGRFFDEHDGPDAPLVMIVSQKTVEKVWGSDDPLGRVVRLNSGKQFTIVGVVGDVRNTALNQDPGPAMYMPATFRMAPLMDVVVRTDGNPTNVLSAVRQRVRDVDAELPLSNVRTMEEWISNNAAQPRLNSVLLEVFAFIALSIAVVGIYGVLSYSVNQRTREIGVRIAMGAQRGHVLRLIVGEGLSVALAGIGAGLFAAVATSRALASLLYGVQARDLPTFAGVAGILMLVALTSCCVPALRATRVDPIVALRDE